MRLLKTKRKEKTTNPGLRDPSAKKSRLREAKITRKRDFETRPSKLLRRFRDRAKILRDPRLIIF